MMKTVKFEPGFKERRKKNKSLGYREKIVMNGVTMTISDALKKYPLELFELVSKKGIKISEPIYMNLLDFVKRENRSLYEEHRKPYKAPFVEKVSKLHNYEVDYVVRNLLKDRDISTLQIALDKDNKKTYHSLNSIQDNPNKRIKVFRAGNKFKEIKH
jgi:hypothetical protein